MKQRGDFDYLGKDLLLLNLQGFTNFVKDFKFPLDVRTISEVYRKGSVNNQPMAFEVFKGSLLKLGVIMRNALVAANKRKHQ